MRVIIQRVKEASVRVDGEVIGEINKGLLVLLGVGEGDNETDINYLADKTVHLRIFANEEGKMDLAARDLDLDILIVPQFTLYGDCHEGKRPNFTSAAPPKEAKDLYQRYVKAVKEYPLKVETGEFGAMMEVNLINDGPVTIMLDSNKEF
ncbi:MULTISPECIES: D-aminoacyl-tRNA deacylase [unclassified Candidatus Frackibacter]|uniref:D-aminoacyl-tRNA deacylase n=1 Tax=unclassified Candidatus Frackibacter TaxID=2648818 RepID=UPI000791E083|nr:MULTISPECIES: D-aminoacyl-tRNA deacylase [unclassified Candidatus Frackibacter]KXS44191.1 MAG: D-tyrosyl-tRNA(Tyr) deacylase [Candidatus Frackibacter sp. T328-2]SDC64506.1 D-tyrosyl-tRNA(Tyr) deacylase [Candidatus Frackibacter sp. WG11]SEM77428.1 D-tyrosyl-tRNA(Tyr) deacylase [Candidatus Frackibacter sp. WG12]SFL88624.1 D-tyrosyl-tRNA(Tyr) deacylase [Candidatus Frackibacter sp. WG13]